MKITREEFHRTEKESEYELFLAGIKAKETKQRYTRTLRRILCDILEDFFSGELEERAKQFVNHARDEPKWTEDLLLQLVKKLKERTELPKDDPNYLNPSTIGNYFKPVKKLLAMNSVPFSWQRIHAAFPEIDNLSDTREWTRQEIQKMLQFANGIMDRLIVLMAASSGIRLGGFDLNWGDVFPIYKENNELTMEATESKQVEIACAMIQVYKGSNQSYPAFITAETYSVLQDYKTEWIRDINRESKPDDPIFKKEGHALKRATPASIKKRVERMAQKAGLRMPLSTGQKRYDVPIMNGFRRFWNKTCKSALSRDSPLASLIKKEYMMGHTGLVRLDRNYFKTHTLELAEEYLSTAPDLTISDEFRLRADNMKLRSEKRRYADSDLLQSMQKRIEDLEYGKEARDAHYAQSTMQAETTREKIMSNLFPIVFEFGNDEEYKRKFWKELKDSQKENRPMNPTVFDPNYVELSEEEKKERYDYALRELKRLEEMKKLQLVKEIENKPNTGLRNIKNPKFNEEYFLRSMLMQ